jgi:hypothetical protein
LSNKIFVAFGALPIIFFSFEANPNDPLDVIDLSEKPSTKGWRAAQDLITHF